MLGNATTRFRMTVAACAWTSWRMDCFRVFSASAFSFWTRSAFSRRLNFGARASVTSPSSTLAVSAGTSGTVGTSSSCVKVACFRLAVSAMVRKSRATGWNRSCRWSAIISAHDNFGAQAVHPATQGLVLEVLLHGHRGVVQVGGQLLGQPGELQVVIPAPHRTMDAHSGVWP